MRLPLFAYVEPGKVPYEAEIPNTLAAEQQAVKESRIDFRGTVIQRGVGALLARCGRLRRTRGAGSPAGGLGGCGPQWARIPGEDFPGILHKELPRPPGERGAGIRPGFYSPGQLPSPGNAGRISLRSQRVLEFFVHFAEGVLFYPQNRPKGSNFGISLEPQGLFRGSGGNSPGFTSFWR